MVYVSDAARMTSCTHNVYPNGTVAGSCTIGKVFSSAGYYACELRNNVSIGFIIYCELRNNVSIAFIIYCELRNNLSIAFIVYCVEYYACELRNNVSIQHLT
jgi:hypothetical protein